MNDTIVIVGGTVLFVLLSASIAILFFISEKRLLKEKNLIQELEINLQNRVISAIIDTQEIERKRLSEDLHDEMGALILALKLSNHQLLYNDAANELQKRIDENEKLIEQIAERVRQVSHNLLPPSLRKGHLESAFEALCTLFRENTDINIRYKRTNAECQIPTGDQVSLYRVVNEWFSNIVKHAKAKNILLDFHKNSSNYILIISDDGIDFDYDKSLITSTGLGLMSMRGRLNKMNAGFFFRKNYPKGTKFEILYPIK